MTTGWRCELHGAVAPLMAMTHLTSQWVAHIAKTSAVPLWMPWPLPTGWTVTGAVATSDTPGLAPPPGAATALVCTGPGARSGPAELVLVSEEPGVGLGAGYAGLQGPDAGSSLPTGAPATRVVANGHEVPLWEVDQDGPARSNGGDRSIYVGEAEGCWLWAVAWPMEAGLLLYDSLRLVDLRDPGLILDVPLGAMSPRWRPGQ